MIPSPVRDGVAAALPMLIGVVPFALVAGAATIDAGYDTGHALGLSIIVFAGASQLAILDVMGSGGGPALAVVTALTVNLRLILYSASVAGPLSHTRLRYRLLAAGVLVDQAYALAIVRWDGADPPRDRMPFLLTVGATLGTSWIIATWVGAILGPSVPDDIPLDFAVPLVFLVLLVPVLERWPQMVAAAFGGIGALITADAGGDEVAVLVGGVLGIAAGFAAEVIAERRHG